MAVAVLLITEMVVLVVVLKALLVLDQGDVTLAHKLQAALGDTPQTVPIQVENVVVAAAAGMAAIAQLEKTMLAVVALDTLVLLCLLLLWRMA